MSTPKNTLKYSEKRSLKEGKKIVPPEGGWGYLMCVGFVLVFVPVFAYKSCYGMIFNEFLEDLGEGISGFSVVSGIYSTMLNIGGVLTSVLLKKFSLRKVGFFGGFMYICGMFGNCFITTVNQMIISISILQGTGCGILLSIGFTSFNQYFVRKRLMVISTTKIFCALGIMVYPMMVKALMQTYGLLGTNMIATAIDLHLFVGVALMQPIKWHQGLKEHTTPSNREDTQHENQSYMNGYIENGDVKTGNIERDSKKISVEEESEKLLSTNNILNDSDVSQTKETNIKNIEDSKEDDQKHSLSIDHAEEMPIEIVTEKNKSKWDLFVKYFDLDLFKDYVFVNIACGMSIGMCTEQAFYMLLPLYLYFINYSMADVALCLSVVSAGDFVARIVISIVSSFCYFKSRSLFFYGVLGSVVLRTIFIYVHSLTGILILSGILGFCRGCMHIPISLVYAEYSTERFTAAYGLGHVLNALFSASITPLFGILKDVTGSYTMSFYLNIVIAIFFFVIPWTLEFWYVDRKNKKIIV